MIMIFAFKEHCFPYLEQCDQFLYNQNYTSCTELTLTITAVTIICIGIFMPFSNLILQD